MSTLPFVAFCSYPPNTVPFQKVIESLLKAGRTWRCGSWRLTPLHDVAEYSQNPVIIEFLLKSGANLEAKNENGRNPCIWRLRTCFGCYAEGKGHGPWVLRFAEGDVWVGPYVVGGCTAIGSHAYRTDTKGSGDTRTANMSAVGPDFGKLNCWCSSPVAGVFGSRETNERARLPGYCGSPPDNPRSSSSALRHTVGLAQ